MEELADYLEFAKSIAIEGGAMAREGFRQKKNIHIKSVAQDLVTETDQKLERLLHDRIRSRFPLHRQVHHDRTRSLWRSENT
jgi:fructose-1,6-bisphosphatase/inositol monophosphatase family enzyme